MTRAHWNLTISSPSPSLPFFMMCRLYLLYFIHWKSPSLMVESVSICFVREGEGGEGRFGFSSYVQTIFSDISSSVSDNDKRFFDSYASATFSLVHFYHILAWIPVGWWIEFWECEVKFNWGSIKVQFLTQRTDKQSSIIINTRIIPLMSVKVLQIFRVCVCKSTVKFIFKNIPFDRFFFEITNFAFTN